MGEQRRQIAREPELLAHGLHLAADAGDFGQAEPVNLGIGHRRRGVARQFGGIKRIAALHRPAARISQRHRQIGLTQIGLPQPIAGIDTGFDAVVIGGCQTRRVGGAEAGGHPPHAGVKRTVLDGLRQHGIDLLQHIFDDDARLEDAGGTAFAQPGNGGLQMAGKAIEPFQPDIVIRKAGECCPRNEIREFDMQPERRVERRLPSQHEQSAIAEIQRLARLPGEHIIGDGIDTPQAGAVDAGKHRQFTALVAEQGRGIAVAQRVDKRRAAGRARRARFAGRIERRIGGSTRIEQRPQPRRRIVRRRQRRHCRTRRNDPKRGAARNAHAAQALTALASVAIGIGPPSSTTSWKPRISKRAPITARACSRAATIAVWPILKLHACPG